MAQIRFNIGVPRAGSAASDAESAQERLRSLRPQAGSAARQAEEQRRTAAADERNRRPGMATLRMRGVSEKDQSARVTAALKVAEQQPGQIAAMTAVTHPAPLLGEQLKSGAVAAQTTDGTASRKSLDSTPLQTAAATFKSLFRSIFSRAEGGN